MGTCASYCMTDNAENKRKITVERQDGDAVAYINANDQEFEIEYGDRSG